MKKIWTILAFTLAFTASGHAGFMDTIREKIWGVQADAPPAMKVLIVHDQPGVILEVKGKYKLYDPHTNEQIGTRFPGKRRFVQPMQDSIKWGEEFPGVHQIRIAPDDNITTVVVDGVEYKGDVYVYDIGGTISVVNEVPIEDYLKSMLVPQFKSKLPHEALAAVAITSRTNAYWQAQNPSNTFWAVDSKMVGYDGYAVAHSNNGVEQAIEGTRQMVMLKDDQTFPAMWGSATGGQVNNEDAAFARITLFEAQELANKGEHAAQILQKAFPNTKVELRQTL